MTIGFTDKTIPAFTTVTRTFRNTTEMYDMMRLHGPVAERVASVTAAALSHIKSCEDLLASLGVDASAVDRADPVGWTLRAISAQKAR